MLVPSRLFFYIVRCANVSSSCSIGGGQKEKRQRVCSSFTSSTTTILSLPGRLLFLFPSSFGPVRTFIYLLLLKETLRRTKCVSRSFSLWILRRTSALNSRDSSGRCLPLVWMSYASPAQLTIMVDKMHIWRHLNVSSHPYHFKSILHKLFYHRVTCRNCYARSMMKLVTLKQTHSIYLRARAGACRAFIYESTQTLWQKIYF